MKNLSPATTGPSKLKKKAPKKTAAFAKAKEAVDQVDTLREQLKQQKTDFEGEFPEANVALDEIKQTEDAVYSAIETAKPLVREAGVTIGEFKYTARTSQPRCDGELLLKELLNYDDESIGAVIREFAELGLLSSLSVDQDAAKIVRSTREDLVGLLTAAWDPGGQKLTPAISVPKL